MKSNKLIIVLIIINILSIAVNYNLIKKEYLNNEKIIVKAMTEGEYENSIEELNTSHEDFVNYIKESKTKIASAITDMGVNTSEETTLENMATNIKSIARDAASISYDNTSSVLASTNVQGAVDEINDTLVGNVLWTNPNPNNTFSEQTITLNDNVENYKQIECVYKRANNENAACYTTGKLPMPAIFTYFGFYCYNSGRGTNVINSGNKIKFTNATFQVSYGSEYTTDNKWAIPLKIIGYK